MSDNSKTEIKWLEAEDNPWNVPVLDLRPVILEMTAWSKDPEHAKNAISYRTDDGLSFRNKNPPNNRKIKVSLKYSTDNNLLDGVLFAPNVMEHKWAIFYHSKSIIFVRSWLREVQVVAKVIQNDNYIELTEIQGVFTSSDERPESTELYLDFLIRTLVYGMVYPVPISKEMAESPQKVPLWCFSHFGNVSLVATPHSIPKIMITEPMRSTSLFHIAIAKGDINSVKTFLKKRVSIDVLAQDGTSPLHWALSVKKFEMANLLIQNGADIDIRSVEGATPLMMAVQAQNMETVQFLIENGANVNKGDNRGYTSLHRSAEMGNTAITIFLLENGANPKIEAHGNSPISLAEKHHHQEILTILKDYL